MYDNDIMEDIVTGFVVVGALLLVVASIWSKNDEQLSTICPNEIQIGDVIIYVTGMKGEVVTCYKSYDSVKIFTGEEYRSWGLDSIIDPPTITWPQAEDGQ